MKTDPLDEFYLVGYLTWNDGVARIEWDSSAESVDPAPPRDPQTLPTADQLLHSPLGFNSGIYVSNTQRPVVDEFVSQPIPHAVFANVSRVIQLDLFVKKGPSPTPVFDLSSSPEIDVELWAGGQLLAGGMAGVTDSVFCPSFPGAGWHSDWGRCDSVSYPGGGIVKHRMSPELELLQAGTTLTLKVRSFTSTFQYGMALDHRSVLRIPFYSPDEVLFRNVDLAGPENADATVGDAGNGEESSTTAFAPLAAVTLQGAILLGKGKPGRRRWVLPVALAILAAGCLQVNGPASNVPQYPRSGSAELTINEYPSGLGNDSLGAVIGLVRDREKIPIVGAVVSILQTPHLTKTGRGGRFSFEDLAPAEYRMRVDAVGFVSLEEEIEVHPAKVTTVQVLLEPVDTRDSNARPHRHDYWGGKDRVEIVSQMLIEKTYAWHGGAPQWVFYPPKTILPGTGEVEVKVSWTPSQTSSFELVYLYAQPNHDSFPGNYSFFYPRSNEAVFHVVTNWEMTDVGHQTYSTWGLFGIGIPEGQKVQSDFGLRDSDPFPPIVFEISIVLHKRILPLEPAHLDLWEGNQTKTIVAGDAANMGGATTTKLVGLNYYDSDGNRYKQDYNSSWASQRLVPPETTWMEVELSLGPAAGATGQAYSGDWVFTHKGAAASSQRNCVPNANPQDARKRIIGTPERDPSQPVWRWRVQLGLSDPDPFYAARSSWCWWIAPASQDAWFQTSSCYDHASALTCTKPKLSLTVIAHRDVMPN